ncbi:MAG: LysR family transcriptional regulator [Syntrophobacteraceae bacterium]
MGIHENLFRGGAAPSNGDLKGGVGMDRHEPTVRLHLWLETGGEMFFGAGRALLLAKIEAHGSLRKAAEDLGMSYRAAWGKIRKTEKVLGVKLIEQHGCKKEGHRLTGHGRFLKEKYVLWFHEVERCALEKAGELFPWPVRSYKEMMRDADPQAQDFEI